MAADPVRLATSKEDEMSFVRHLILMTLFGVVTVCLTGSHALAQNVEVEHVFGGHCEDVTATSHGASGGCQIAAHSAGPILLTAHLSPTFEIAGSLCNSEFEAHLNESGGGYITNQVLSGDGCSTPRCVEAGGNGGPRLWPVQLREDSFAGEKLDLTFCVVSSTFGIINCQIDVDVFGFPGSYSFEAVDKRCKNITGYPNFEVDGHWTIEDQDITIHHL
jgi:hypothetical protein